MPISRGCTVCLSPRESSRSSNSPQTLPRAGILGQATFLASTTGPVETSPTARGLFVREHLLCQIVPNPPPGVNTNLPEPATADAARAKRERMLEHATNPVVLGLSSPDGSHRVRAGEVRRRRRVARQGNRRYLCRRGRSAAEQASAGRHHRDRRNRRAGELDVRRFARAWPRAGGEPCLPGLRGQTDVSLCLRPAPKCRRTGRRSQARRPRFGARGSNSKNC